MLFHCRLHGSSKFILTTLPLLLSAALVSTAFQRCMADTEAARNAYNSGVNLSMSRQYLQAIPYFDAAIREDPKWAQPYINRGVCYNQLNHPEMALPSFNSAIKLEPKHSGAYHNRGLAYHKLKKFDLALNDFNQALSLEKDSFRALTLDARGLLYGNLGDVEKARQDFNAALRYPGADDNIILARRLATEHLQRLQAAVDQFAHTHNSTGNSLLAKREYDKAVNEFDQALAINPQLTTSLSMRAAAYVGLQQYDKALDSLNKAVQSDSKDTKLRVARANVYGLLKQYSKALEDYSECLRVNPRDVDAYAARGEMYLLARDYDKALQDFDQILQFRPGNGPTTVMHCLTNVAASRDEAALADASKYLAAAGLDNKDSIRASLLAYVSSRRLHKDEDAKKTLSDAAAHIKQSDWPNPVVQYLLKQMTADQLLAAATDNEKLTDANGWIAVNALLNGEQTKAQENFHWLQDKGNPTADVYKLALAELTKMQAPPAANK